MNILLKKIFIKWCTGGLWFNGKICHNLHGPMFEDFLVTAHKYRYNLIFGLNAYNKENDNSTNLTKFCGGRPMPDDFTTVSIISLCVSIKSIDM